MNYRIRITAEITRLATTGVTARAIVGTTR